MITSVCCYNYALFKAFALEPTMEPLRGQEHGQNSNYNYHHTHCYIKRGKVVIKTPRLAFFFIHFVVQQI